MSPQSQKGNPCQMDLPLLKKRYHTNFMDMICASLYGFTSLLFNWFGFIKKIMLPTEHITFCQEQGMHILRGISMEQPPEYRG